MLLFAGLGISSIKSISQELKDKLKNADIVYFEQFTSPISSSEISYLKKIVKGQLIMAKRWLVEDGNEILKNSKKKKVVLLSYGDPFIATTHIELRVRAIRDRIKTDVVHAASSLTSMIGECGLHYYKVGRVSTIMKEMQSLTTPYYVIYRNLADGNHSILLLEYNQDEKFFLDPNDALASLFLTEKEQKRNVVNESTFVIIASRIGFRTQKIIAGKISSLKKFDFGKPPHTIIIPGLMHFTEEDAVKEFAECVDEPISNSSFMKKISLQMIEKYVPMVKKAIEEIAPLYEKNSEFKEVIENAKLYVDDAEKFLEQGKDEVAILSIGYADGLVDSLRIAKGLEPRM